MRYAAWALAGPLMRKIFSTQELNQLPRRVLDDLRDEIERALSDLGFPEEPMLAKPY